MEKSGYTNRVHGNYNPGQNAPPKVAGAGDVLTINELVIKIGDIPDGGLTPAKLRSLMQAALKASPEQRLEIHKIFSSAASHAETVSEGDKQRVRIANLCFEHRPLDIEGIQAATAVQQSAVKTICNLPNWLQNGTLVQPTIIEDAWEAMCELAPAEGRKLAEAFRDSYHFGAIADLLPALEPDMADRLDKMFGLTPAITTLDRLLKAGSASEAEIAQYNHDKYGAPEERARHASQAQQTETELYFFGLARDFYGAYSETDALPYFGIERSDFDTLIFVAVQNAHHANNVVDVINSTKSEQVASGEAVGDQISDEEPVDEMIEFESDFEDDDPFTQTNSYDYNEKNHILRSIINYTLNNRSDLELNEYHSTCSAKSFAAELWKLNVSGMSVETDLHIIYLLDIVRNFVEYRYPERFG